MNRPVRTGKDFDEARARILEAAEKQFRRVGYHRTSVADIAAELGVSAANIYRFFPSRDAINESICGRVVNEVAEIASAIARTNAPAMQKLDQLLTAVHRHNKVTLLEAKSMHDLIVAATQENWPVIKAHIQRMVTIFEAIIREYIRAEHIIPKANVSRRRRRRLAGQRARNLKPKPIFRRSSNGGF
jgi:AcrR family transcriptional regulator